MLLGNHRGGNRPAMRLCQYAIENSVPGIFAGARALMPTIYVFRGRGAVVTGGAQGIGRAIAARLLQGGATVWLWDIDLALAKTTAAELEGAGAAFAAPVDVTNLAQLE